MSQILCLWSGPRNISTAMMRSFGARDDVTCWDEPFFAPFLDVTGLDHPGRDETLEQCETDPQRVSNRLIAPISTRYHFQKHMAHHMLPAFPLNWAANARHVILLRHPARVIASYAKGRPDFAPQDLGFHALRQLKDTFTSLCGRTPMIVDSDDILKGPASALRSICEEGFGIEYDPKMLDWSPGPRPEDGPWAPYWYANVIRSSGFGPPPGALPEIEAQYEGILSECMHDYEPLKAASTVLNAR